MKKLLVSLTIIASLAAAADYSATASQTTEINIGTSTEVSELNVPVIIDLLDRENDTV